uniref:Uncharacterized protein n=1 Tax=Aureoumbra lagunensis TaxID=44058 RepID=A0A7S3K2B2_9STRA|mmetsp:Transcript_14875/g.19729  ORF Transcript_14875/g.19729 Transcript_14875/m.19729 type:complete len:278 (-) Transcript_14875:999-1832(-)|eukprot:CAMPEP_0197290708 /NCGR_PEP_ID=MMETSP0890-20130614/9253_1 /TAXON_ID=44058 ORGANISM="Aureoumbra lagunensis, Strain CCMP1510" /NCGR_SAMPLE_ID=MMETSP0890 /ASSEMBLY_ACC=CAM_ASM_000533 /LENGTH=277 /DNA_ID=CAMNT_0042762913 /DNA_START=90 /DNA_END=923 /DNA_ORIENTATION=-
MFQTFIILLVTTAYRSIALSVAAKSVLPSWAQIRVEDVLVQRAIQQTSCERNLMAKEIKYLLHFLDHNLSPGAANLDALLCHGEEFLFALRATPKRQNGIEPSKLAQAVVDTAECLVDDWIEDLQDISSGISPGEKNDETLERYCTVKAAAELVDISIQKIACAGSQAKKDLVPEFPNGKPTQEPSLLAANADLAVVAAFAASYVPPLVQGENISTAETLDALRSWSPPPDLPGGYLVQSDDLADKLQSFRSSVAREAAARLEDYRENDLSEFVLGF